MRQFNIGTFSQRFSMRSIPGQAQAVGTLVSLLLVLGPLHANATESEESFTDDSVATNAVPKSSESGPVSQKESTGAEKSGEPQEDPVAVVNTEGRDVKNTMQNAVFPSLAEEANGSTSKLDPSKDPELKTWIQSEIARGIEAERQEQKRNEAWEPESWLSVVRPRMNFLDIHGYYRLRFDIFNRLDLGTYDPTFTHSDGRRGRGTSLVPPPTRYFPFNGYEGCADDDDVPNQPNDFPGHVCEDAGSTSRLQSMNMRLRLTPTLNISEDIRIHSTVDIFDNLVLGSTGSTRPGFQNALGNPMPVFTETALPPQAGSNAVWDSVRVQRVWGDVNTTFGRFEFGRMPLQWGLGILRNGGNGLDNDFGDTADQLKFSTLIGPLELGLAYQIVASGPYGRGGGAGLGADALSSNWEYAAMFSANELGQRYNLDPSDDVHSLTLELLRKDDDETWAKGRGSEKSRWNAGLLGEYRYQDYALPTWTATGAPGSAPTVQDIIRRNASAGLFSLWFRYAKGAFELEAEGVGIIGSIKGTGRIGSESQGLQALDDNLNTVEGAQDLWVLQGGLALESSYRLLDDRLVLGLDFGIASGDSAPGFGIRPQYNSQPKSGDADGLQYGECLSSNDDGDCLGVDNDVTNFRFDPDYIVDLILYREILGTVTDSFYIKPHIAYHLTDRIGARLDGIYSHAIYTNSTPGLANSLGFELDGSMYFGTEDGFYLMFQAGFLLPFSGLDHARDPDDPSLGRDFGGGNRVNGLFLDAKWAYTFQTTAGIQF